ncbi:MAG: type II toxin-antitoxin system VapC family toxin [Acidobacteriia bacterium]|nr:type II toxin-antitoxin system VapC family toxin [Terriglobia bacterium]
MKYLLDTNAWVDYLTGRFPTVVARIQKSAPDDLCLSSVVMAELRYGAEKSRRKKFNHDLLDTLAREVRCVDFDLDGARTYGELRTRLEKRGTPIGPYDMMIAAHALSLGLTVVTDNEHEFRRVRSLPVENWRDRRD